MGLEHKINYCKTWVGEHVRYNSKLTIDTFENALEKSRGQGLEAAVVNLIHSNLARRFSTERPMALSLSRLCVKSNDLQALLNSFEMFKSSSPILFEKYHDLLDSYTLSPVFDKIYLTFNRFNYGNSDKLYGTDKESLIDYLQSHYIKHNIVGLKNPHYKDLLVNTCVSIWNARGAYPTKKLLENEDKDLFKLLGSTECKLSHGVIISYFIRNMDQLSKIAKDRSEIKNPRQRYFQFRKKLLEHQSGVKTFKKFVGKSNFDQVVYLYTHLEKKHWNKEIKFLNQNNYPTGLEGDDLVKYISHLKYNFGDTVLRDSLTSNEIKQLVKSYCLAHQILILGEAEADKTDYDLNYQRDVEDDLENYFVSAMNKTISYGNKIKEKKSLLIQWSNNLYGLIKKNPEQFLDYFEILSGDNEK